jgi:hypothetical protein
MYISIISLVTNPQLEFNIYKRSSHEIFAQPDGFYQYFSTDPLTVVQSYLLKQTELLLQYEYWRSMIVFRDHIDIIIYI